MKEKARLSRKPNRFLWYVPGNIVRLWYKTKVKFRREKVELNDRAIFLCPHRNYFDCIIYPMAIYPKWVHIVSTSYWYRNKRLGKFLDTLGCIKKDQFKSDLISIRQMSECLSLNEPIMMFPEGQMGADSRTQNLVPGLEKFIKKYEPHVYVIHSRGAYAVRPKWAKNMRKGHVYTYITHLYSPDDIKKTDKDTILKTISDEMKKDDDLLWLKEHKEEKYVSRRKAEGLEKALVYCPVCHTEKALHTEKNHLSCECGFHLEFEKTSYRFLPNEYGFEDLYDLFNLEYNLIAQDIKNNIVLEDECNIVEYGPENDIPHNYTKVRMTLEKITFIGPDGSLDLDLDKIISFIVTLGVAFEVPTSDGTYRVKLKDGKRAIHYWYLLKYLKENSHESTDQQ